MDSILGGEEESGDSYESCEEELENQAKDLSISNSKETPVKCTTKVNNSRCFLCKTGRKTASVSMHKFPANLDMQAAWLILIGREGYTLKGHEHLCSDHFTDDCFVYSSK